MDKLKELNLAIKAAKNSGKFLKNSWEKQKRVMSQDGRDIKLALDRESEIKIKQELSQSSIYPILGEEYGESGEINLEKPFWVVDPIDGTMNFYKGLPLCAVSIALWQGEAPILGVVYDFMADELYSGIPGQGSYVNGSPIKVNSINSKKFAVIATGFPVAMALDKESMSSFWKLICEFKKIRMLGSAALAMTFVSCQKVDAYYERNIRLWDIAGAAAVLLGAGGYMKMEATQNEKWTYTVFASGCLDLWN